MNPEIKRLWIDALRSGQYSQGEGVLQDAENNYCCLGVLCDLHSKATGGKWIWDTDDDGNEHCRYSPGDNRFTEQEVLPTSVVVWAGLQQHNPNVGLHECGARLYGTLAELNDYGYTFDKISDIIEERL